MKSPPGGLFFFSGSARPVSSDAILVLGNLHISAYRRALDVRLTASPGVAIDF